MSDDDGLFRHARSLSTPVARRDAAGAGRVVLEHLNHIEGSLKLDAASGEINLEEVFKA